MHTATRLAIQLLDRVKKMNPTAHVCFYGLYAPMNEHYLRQLGADTILGGEFEEGLVSLGRRLHQEKLPVANLSDWPHLLLGCVERVTELGASIVPSNLCLLPEFRKQI